MVFESRFTFKKIIGVLFFVFIFSIMASVMVSASNIWCYQESANTTNQSGTDTQNSICNLNYSGNYYVPNLNDGFIYVNYSKPSNAINGSLWQIKHGNVPTTYNITLPFDCWNQSKLQLGVYTSADPSDVEPPPPFGSTRSQPYCYNGTDWKTIGNLYFDSNDYPGFGPDASPTLFFDGNWSSKISHRSGPDRWQILANPPDLEKQMADIYEEAMWWKYDIPTIVNINSCQELFYGTLYNLTGNINNATNTNCFTFDSPNATLECNKFVIDGNITSSFISSPDATKNQIAIYSNQNLTTIRNCTITNWQNGIYLNNSNNNVVLNNNMSFLYGGNVFGITLDKVSNSNFYFNNIFNLTGTTGNSADGGLSGGFYLNNLSNNLIYNNSVFNIKGGVGGSSATAQVPGKSGGNALGFYLNNVSNDTIHSNKINNLISGDGGSASNLGSGGSGGIATGFYLNSAITSTIFNNVITNLTVGLGAGGDDSIYDDCQGVDGNYFGFYFSSFLNVRLYNVSFPNNLNSLNGESIVYLFNESNLAVQGYNLTNAGSNGYNNPSNFGKITVYGGNNINVSNNNLSNFRNGFSVSPSGGTTGLAGELSSGLRIVNSTNFYVLNNNVLNIRGGLAGSGGCFYGTGGQGGNGVGIYLINVSNFTVYSNNINNISGANGHPGGQQSASGGKGGLGVGFYIDSSSGNNVFSNVITNLSSGNGGAGGHSVGTSGENGVTFGFYFSSFLNVKLYNVSFPNNLNSLNGESIVYLFNESNLVVQGYNLTNAGSNGYNNPSNFGKITVYGGNNINVSNNNISFFTGDAGASGSFNANGLNGDNVCGICIINSSNPIVNNNYVSNITGGIGGPAGGLGGSGRMGGLGGLAFAIKLWSSNLSKVINNDYDYINGGRRGLLGGQGSSVNGLSGNSSLIYLLSSYNCNLSDTVLNASKLGGNAIYGAYLSSSSTYLSNITCLNTFVNGSCGYPSAVVGFLNLSKSTEFANTIFQFNINALINDGVWLGGIYKKYVFSTNNSNVWVNDSEINITDTILNINLSTVKVLSSQAGSVGWQYFVFDVFNNVYASNVFGVIVQVHDSVEQTVVTGGGSGFIINTSSSVVNQPNVSQSSQSTDLSLSNVQNAENSLISRALLGVKNISSEQKAKIILGFGVLFIIFVVTVVWYYTSKTKKKNLRKR